MLASLLIKIILSVIIILLLQYLYNYFKTNMSSPLEKNIIEDTQKKYEEMYNVLKNGSSHVNTFEPKSTNKNSNNIEPLNMESMKEELLKYIDTLE